MKREREFGAVGLGGRATEPGGVNELAARVAAAVGREPLVFPFGPGRVERVAISTGAAGHELIRAAHEGYDLFLTGEPEEPSQETARELGIHFVAAGHHATERLGVQALARRLAEEHDLEWEFVEIPNPV